MVYEITHSNIIASKMTGFWHDVDIMLFKKEVRVNMVDRRIL
jgi:hypothetical protein